MKGLEEKKIWGFSHLKRMHFSFVTCSIFSMSFVLFVIILGDFATCVVGQSSFANISNTSCMCGVDRVPCLKSPNCPNGRVIPRRDCPCCLVCAKQLTDECNNEEQLCDADYGLECGSDKRCKAKTTCNDDTGCLSDLMCFGGACADPCKVLPDVCKETNVTNGICVSRSHRALCTCPPATILKDDKECVSSLSAPEDNFKKCNHEGRELAPGETIYTNQCKKSCKCEPSGEISCEDASTFPDCKLGFISVSNITGEMTAACKIFVGNDALFDGCCVPEQCQVINSQDHDEKGGRDFKLTESHNNLGEDDKSKLKIESTKEIDDGEYLSNNESLKAKEISQEKGMQVTVLKLTDHSALIELPKNDKVAILSISLSNELIKNSESSEVWKKHRLPPGLPQITLAPLLPNTSYTLKYAVDNKDYPTVEFSTNYEYSSKPSKENTSIETTNSSVSDSTEVETFTTSMPSSNPAEETIHHLTTTKQVESDSTMQPVSSSVGCLHNGTSYEIGETFHVGCDDKCECYKGGEVKCIPLCTIPLFKKGSFAHDKMCFEEPSGIDECCVFIACARGNPHGRAENSGREIIALIPPQPCDSVKCGLNAHCLGPTGSNNTEDEQQTNQTLCVCDNFYIGDPYEEQGCQPNSTPATNISSSSSSSSTTSSLSPSSFTSTIKPDGCIFKNKTYEYGEEQNDGCSYKCRCETSGEFLCVPRCNYRRDEDEEKEIPAGCEIKKDPSDLECCEMLICHGEPLESGTKKDTLVVPNDGCIYQNKSYARNEKFYDGCSEQCMCYANGDVTCQPRCPPASNSSGHDCVSLPDPVDHCCMVTVCGNATLSDVMKAANDARINSTNYPETATTLAKGEGRSNILNPSYTLHISFIHPFNETSVMVASRIADESLESLADTNFTIQYSKNRKDWNNITWKVKDAIRTGLKEISVPIFNLSQNTEYFFRAKLGDVESETIPGFTKFEPLGSIEDGEFTSQELPSEFEEESDEGDMTTENDSAAVSSEKIPCMFKDKKYEYGDGAYDNCDSYCTCRSGGNMKCVKLECPSDGYDLVDDTCMKWEADPTFKIQAPACCPKMVCKQFSSCTLDNGMIIKNYDEIPQKYVGCDKTCFCEFGNIACQKMVCPPVSEHPPKNLPCPRDYAEIVPIENECCLQWACGRVPHIPHLHNISHFDASPSTPKPSTMLDNTKSPQTHPSQNDNTTSINHPVVPPTENQPPLINLDKLHPNQLQELLHHLSSLGEGPAPDKNDGSAEFPDIGGAYVQVQTPQQVEELVKTMGAKFIDRAEDGSFVVLIPNHGLNSFEDQNYSDHFGQGPPFAHAIPPSGFPGGPGFPFGHGHFHQGPDRNKVSDIVIQRLNDSTLQIDFTVSQLFVGLQGHVEVLYTHEFEQKPNPSQWDIKVFQQAEDLIDNAHLQLFLTNLKSDTVYHLQIKVVVRQTNMGSNSDILEVRTLPPPEIVLDPEIQMRSASSNSVKLFWKKFSEKEKKLMDGIQVTYRASDDKVYSTTPLLHRSLTEYELENLLPNKNYEINLLFVPFNSSQQTVLKSNRSITIQTAQLLDEYTFHIAISQGKVTEKTIELNIEGVPDPENKFVIVYQVMYTSDSQKEQKDYFKVPMRETSKKATLKDLKPGTNYSLYVDAFLSNGKKKRSNVINIRTKAGELPRPEMSGQEDNHPHDLRASQDIPSETSYYGALVALSIVTALSIIGVIALLMIFIRKQNSAKAPINDRKSESSYDNPSFKSYDVESNGHMKPSEL